MCYTHLSFDAVHCPTPNFNNTPKKAPNSGGGGGGSLWTVNTFSKADMHPKKAPNSGGGGGGSLWTVTPYTMKCSLLTV
jgi:hypothetical protein